MNPIDKIFASFGGFSLYAISFLLGALGTFYLIDYNLFSPINKRDKAKVSFVITEGKNLNLVAKELESKKLLRNWWSLTLLDKINEKESTVYKGEFLLSPSQTPKELLATISDESKINYKIIALLEGATVAEIEKLIASSGIVTLNEIHIALNDTLLLEKLSINSYSFEGYLFPETYKFTKPINASDIVSRMVKEGENKIKEELPGWKERASELGFKPEKIITLASIIEKETGVAKERATISSVFHNRLKIGMPLQSDPTVIYGIKDFNGNLTKKDLQNPSPFNTYLNLDLPPTPIASPGLEAIRAALYPEDTEYLYFVAKGDGTHQFSKSYKEHSDAVELYQRKK